MSEAPRDIGDEVVRIAAVAGKTSDGNGTAAPWAYAIVVTVSTFAPVLEQRYIATLAQFYPQLVFSPLGQIIFFQLRPQPACFHAHNRIYARIEIGRAHV